MYKVKQLYVLFDDDSGHKYLIPKTEYGAFEKYLSRIEESLDEHKDEDIYYDELNDILDALSDQRLEGEEIYVVVPNDVIKGGEMKFEIGDKVKVIEFIETMLDAPIETIGDVGEVNAIDLDQGDYLYHVTFQNDPEGWNYKETQLEIFKGEED